MIFTITQHLNKSFGYNILRCMNFTISSSTYSLLAKNGKFLLAIMLSLSCSVLGHASPDDYGCMAMTYIVNSTNDIDDGTCNATHCSLREAINAANSDNQPSSIHFSLSGAVPYTISLTDGLPNITDDGTIIDGTTQSGWVLGRIIIDGTNTDREYGLRFLASDCQIYGLQIQNFTWGGISFGQNTTTYSNNIVGAPNKGNIIGKMSSGSGIRASKADNLIVQNNYLGTNPSGTMDLGNNSYGVSCSGGSKITISNNLIGYNNHSGISINTLDTAIITNNNIGTNAAGTRNMEIGRAHV